MGCGDSKLNAQGMLQSWVSQRAASFTHRRGVPKDQLLGPLELPDPNTPSNSMADSDHNKDNSNLNNETQHNDVNEGEEEKDSKIEVEAEVKAEIEVEGDGDGEGGKEKKNISEDENEREREDSIGQCPGSPSFRVYCLDNGQQMEDGDDDDDIVDGSVDSNPINFRVMEAQSSHASNDVEIMKKSEGRRKKGRKGFIQKDMFKGAGKTIMHLKLPHRRASSDVGVITSVHRQDDVKQKSKDDQTEINNGSHHHRHHHHHESNHQRQRHHQKPPHMSHHSNDSNHGDGSNLVGVSDTNGRNSCELNESNSHKNHHHHPKMSHNSHHGSSHDDENNHNNGHTKHNHSSHSDDPKQ